MNRNIKPSNVYLINFFLIQKLDQVVKEQHEANSNIMALVNQLKDQFIIQGTQNQRVNDEIQEIKTQLVTMMTTKQKISQHPNAGNNDVD